MVLDCKKGPGLENDGEISNYEELKTNIAKLLDKVSALQLDNVRLFNENAQFSAQVNALTQSNKELTAQVSALKAQVSALKAQVSALELSNAQLLQENKELSADVRDLKLANAQSLTRITTLEFYTQKLQRREKINSYLEILNKWQILFIVQNFRKELSFSQKDISSNWSFDKFESKINSKVSGETKKEIMKNCTLFSILSR